YHAIVHGMVRAHGKDRARHDVSDPGVLRGFSLQDDLAGVITFGNDADQPLVGDHHQRPYTFVGHQAYRLEDRLLRAHRPDAVALVLQNRADGIGHLWLHTLGKPGIHRNRVPSGRTTQPLSPPPRRRMPSSTDGTHSSSTM